MRSPPAKGVHLEVRGLVVFMGMLCPQVLAQSSPATLAVDPFIVAIHNIKRSVTPVDCMTMRGAEAQILYRKGSAFFVSRDGKFLTAAHVIEEMLKSEPPCPTSAIILPVGDWHAETRDEPYAWFPFNPSACKIDNDSDLAVCRPSQDLSDTKLTARIAPVNFEWSVPPDGAQVAFTGFPLNARDPLTVRAAVAAFRIPWQKEKPIPELALDRAAWPGSSGSPVYLSDGTVIAILIANGKDYATGVTLARPSAQIRQFLSEK